MTISVLWRLARPRLALWMLGLVLFGYAFAHWDQLLVARAPLGLALLLGAWALGNAGTMWLNAGLDREESDAVFASAGPVPRHVGLAGYAALAGAVALAAGTTGLAVGCVVGCALLAIAYSHPRLAWKGHPVLGPLVNVIGYGLLSPLAGWSLAHAPLSFRTVGTFALWSLWLLGAYFSAQAFQQQDDERRGYRTLVVTHGPATTLRVARWCMNGAITASLALTILGVYPRLTLLAYPTFLVADRWMLRWQRQPDGGGPEWATGLFIRMLFGGLFLFALAYVDYWFLD
jgi:4-hydroxybenzoate polyprenyltransferase